MPLAPAAPRSCLPPADALRMGLQRCSAGDALPPIFTGPRVSLLSFLKDIFRRGQGSRLAVSLSARGRRLPWPARCRRSRPGCSGRRVTAPFRAIRLLSATAHDFSSFSSFSLRRGACFMPSILSGVCPACPAVRSRSAGLSYAAGFPPRVLGSSTQQAPFN